MHSSNVDFYNKIYKEYDASRYFEETVIKIRYIDGRRFNKNDEDFRRAYKILGMEIESDNEVDETLKKFIDDCNEKVASGRTEWQLFYLYKELIQFLTKKCSCNYFRGQSDSYPLMPGILREGVQNNYRHHFESLYKRIANEFPEKISYFSLETESLDRREEQLALLQHYGLKTSLLDVTQNPYVSMLFMLSGLANVAKKKTPTLFFFKINEENHKVRHLFTDVKKDKINERIIAQKGAFLNFDKLSQIKSYDVEKIELYKIVLEYDEKFHRSFLENEIGMIDNLLEIFSDDEDQQKFKKPKEKLEKYKVELIQEKQEIDENVVRLLDILYKELKEKLREYHYFEEDLFPDFERKIGYLAKQFETREVKILSSDIE